MRPSLLPALMLALPVSAPLLAQTAKPGPAPVIATDWTPLGQVGDWHLERRGPAGAPEECAVWRMSGQETGLRFWHGINGSVIAFVSAGSAAETRPMPVTVYWNGDLGTRSDEVMPLDDSQFWRGMALAQDMPDPRSDFFANGSGVTFVYQVSGMGQQVATFPLAGSGRAMRAALDCAMPAR